MVEGIQFAMETAGTSVQRLVAVLRMRGDEARLANKKSFVSPFCLLATDTLSLALAIGDVKGPLERKLKRLCRSHLRRCQGGTGALRDDDTVLVLSHRSIMKMRIKIGGAKGAVVATVRTP